MGFAVFHAVKGKGSGSSLGAHIDREVGQEHTYKNADKDKRENNIHYQVPGSGKPLHLAIKDRIKEGYKTEKAIRKDAVKYVPMVFSGSHEDMKTIFKDEKKAKEWVQANYKFCENEFGAENIMRFTLHLDEKTPHIHAVIVPITKDGRLTAKEVLGGREEMSARQTRYAEAMQPFGLQRGVVGSKAIHNSEGWYLGRQKEAQEAKLASLPKFSLSDRVNPNQFIESVSNRLKIASRETEDLILEVSRRNRQLEQVQLQNIQQAEELKNYEIRLRDKDYRLQIALAKVNGLLKPELDSNFQQLNKEYLRHINRPKPPEDLPKIDKNKGLKL